MGDGVGKGVVGVVGGSVAAPTRETLSASSNPSIGLTTSSKYSSKSAPDKSLATSEGLGTGSSSKLTAPLYVAQKLTAAFGTSSISVIVKSSFLKLYSLILYNFDKKSV